MTRDSNDLLAKLTGSSAYHSIRSEQEIVKCIETNGWSAFHSPFYCDAVTGKTREIDVVGIQRWEKKTRKAEISATLKLYIEAKSARDSHILMSGRSQFNERLDQYWIGYEENTLEAIAETLSKEKFDGHMIREFLQKLEKLAFPRHMMKTRTLRVTPYPVDECYSAFRETTIGVDKELDNSVLWRALSALRSSIEAEKKKIEKNLLDDLSYILEFAIRNNYDQFEMGLDEFTYEINHLKLFHPVVVIDSTLWSVIQRQPKQLKWFRFVQRNANGHVEWWADVVASSAFGEFAKAITEHYQKQYRVARATRG